MEKIIQNIQTSFENAQERQSCTLLLFSNFKILGIDILEKLLLQNGFVKYREDRNYLIDPNFHVDFKYGKTKNELLTKNIPFVPAVFIKISGDIEEEKNYQTIQNIFNSPQNIEG